MECLNKMSVIMIAKTTYKISVIPVVTMPILLNTAFTISSKKDVLNTHRSNALIKKRASITIQNNQK